LVLAFFCAASIFASSRAADLGAFPIPVSHNPSSRRERERESRSRNRLGG
jgi:hypothetical protein